MALNLSAAFPHRVGAGGLDDKGANGPQGVKGLKGLMG